MFGNTRTYATAAMLAAILAAAAVPANAAASVAHPPHRHAGATGPVITGSVAHRPAPVSRDMMVATPMTCRPGHFWTIDGPAGDPGDSEVILACPATGF